MKNCHEIEQNIPKAIFLLFMEREILLMKNENEASIPEFSSWTLYGLS